MMELNGRQLVVEDGIIINRNFSGDEKSFEGRIMNERGKRNFCVKIDDPDFATMLNEEGWNVKARLPREEGDETTYFLPVKVIYHDGDLRRLDPKIFMVQGRIPTRMDEDMVSELDEGEIISADLTINRSGKPTFTKADGSDGYTAYLDEGYFVKNVSRFQNKWTPSDEEAPF